MQHNFIGEDRNCGGSELYVDLIPRSCWFTNVRYCVEPSDWDKIRKKVYSRINYTCECCFINCIQTSIPIEAHERWIFDYTSRTQKLVRLIGLCKPCHQVTHIGFAKIIGKEQESLDHLRKVRNFNLEELTEHVDKAYTIWIERNQIDWELDLSLITSNGFRVKSIDKADRKTIVENKLI